MFVVKLVMAMIMALAITLVFNAAVKVLGLETVLAMLLFLAIVACLAKGRRR